MNRPAELLPPLGYYESTLDWVENSGLNKKEILYNIYPEIAVPKILNKNEQKLMADKPRYSSKAFVVIMHNARVLEDRAVISPDNKLLWDISVEWAKSPEEHSIFQEIKLPPSVKTKQATALLTHPAAYNYYHWMLEALARIHLLQKSNLKIEKYIVNHNSIPFQLETLTACGVPFDKIIQPHKGFHLEAEQLVIPSYVNLPNVWSCSYVRNTFLPQMNLKKIDKYKRIYITRKFYRIVVNEKKILKALKKYGFRKLELESMPVQKQISIFHSAEVIIAPHGAGLANLIFCRPGTTVIELFSPSFIEPHYWLISRLINLNYHFIVGKRRNRHHYWAGFDNMYIDVKRLVELLNKITIIKRY